MSKILLFTFLGKPVTIILLLNKNFSILYYYQPFKRSVRIEVTERFLPKLRLHSTIINPETTFTD